MPLGGVVHRVPLLLRPSLPCLNDLLRGGSIISHILKYKKALWLSEDMLAYVQVHMQAFCQTRARAAAEIIWPSYIGIRLMTMHQSMGYCTTA